MTACPPIEISVAFATTRDTSEHVALAEQLGFARAWLYDTPQQSPDVWMCLALPPQRNHSIGLAPGVLVPTLRHPMVNPADAAALQRLAPGRRVAVGFGTGHTGRRAMGQPQTDSVELHVALYHRRPRPAARRDRAVGRGRAVHAAHRRIGPTCADRHPDLHQRRGPARHRGGAPTGRLYSYLASQSGRGNPAHDNAEGVLLFVKTETRDVFDEEVTVQGHRVRFMSVDLGERPAQIRARWMQCLAPAVPAPSPERPAG